MASRARHLEQAQHNRRIALQLLGTWPDDPYAVQWVATAAFYCALHCVEAYFADRGPHSLNHEHRSAIPAEDGRDARQPPHRGVVAVLRRQLEPQRIRGW